MQRACAGEDFYAFQSFSRQLEATQGVFRVAELVFEVYLSIRLHAHAQQRIFFAFYSFYRDSEGIQGVFRVADLVSEVYLSIRLHAHAQEMIFTHFKAFHGNWRYLGGCSSR